METADAASIPGFDRVVAWFGRVPSFHDAELLELDLHRDGSARMVLHAWNITDSIDEKGFFELAKNAIVTLQFEGVGNVSLDGNCFPAIIFELNFWKVAEGIEVEWVASWGLGGKITARLVTASLTPGRPPAVGE